MTRAKEEEVSLSASFIDRLGGKSQTEMGGHLEGNRDIKSV